MGGRSKVGKMEKTAPQIFISRNKKYIFFNSLYIIVHKWKYFQGNIFLTVKWKIEKIGELIEKK